MSKKNNKTKITLIIPALNEGALLQKVINDCLKIKNYSIEILVIIDDKASQSTRKVAKKSKAKVIDIGKGAGKGAAVRMAIPHIKSEYVIQIDADYQFMPYEIPKLMFYLLEGYDVVLGTRYQKGSSIEIKSVSLFRKAGSYSLSLVASLFARKRITDVMAGFKGFKSDVLKDLNPKVNHFGYEAELVIRASKMKYKIINVPITYKKREVGNSNVSSIKHGSLVLGTIIKTGLEKGR